MSGNSARARLRASAASGYRWYTHVAMIAVFVFFGIAAVLTALAPLTWSDAGLLLAELLLLNLGEYAIHRWVLHRRVFPRMLYQRHVIEHHAFFPYEQMGMEARDDIRWVLFPWWALPLLVVATVPAALLISSLVSARAGGLFPLAVMLYYGVYELIHTLAHLPPDGLWSRHRWVGALTYHHRVHHDLALMRGYNFNFIVPIFDWLFGTTYRRRSNSAPTTSGSTYT